MYSQFDFDDAIADTLAPEKLIFENETNSCTMFGFPAFSHSRRIFLMRGRSPFM